MTTSVAPSLAGPGQTTRPRRRGIRRTWPMYLAVAPFFILFLVFGLYPTMYSLVLSFQDWNGLGDPTWVGLQNFQKLFADPTFYLSIRNTFVIFALSTFPMLVIAIVIAAMLNSAVRFSTAFRIAYFIPNITSVVAMAVLFGSIFGQNFGLANTLLHAIGLPAIPWLSTPFGIQVTVSLLITYQWTGYNAIIFLAGMQSIGGEVYEAAKIDGAGAVRSFFSITLPLLRPTVIFVLVVSTITGLQSFTEAQVLTTTAGSTNSGGAGQGGLTMVLYFYQQAFGFNRFGYGAAIAWGVFLIVVVFTIISWRFTAGRKEEAQS